MGSHIIVRVFISLRPIHASHFYQIPECHSEIDPCDFFPNYVAPDGLSEPLAGVLQRFRP